MSARKGLRMLALGAAAGAAVAAGSAGAMAERPERPAPTDPRATIIETIVEGLEALGEMEAGEPAPLPKIAKATTGFTAINNNLDKDEATLFTLYRKDDRLLGAFPEELLEKPWLLSSTFSAGPYLTGFQIGSTLVEWRRRDRELQLVEPEVRYGASKGGPNAENIRRTYTDRHILTTPIIAADDDGRVLVDLGSTLLSNSSKLVGELGLIDSSIARVQKAKAFAQNVEVAITSPHTHWLLAGQLVTLHYSLSALPEETDMAPRRADQRVGYWVHATKDFSQRHPLRSKFVRNIERWRLEKADPALALSPPKAPIVFYIEKSVPLEHRSAVRRGVEAWNEAFRAVGIENAIEVRQQTETRHAEIDPEDVRYNFVRWITTEGGFAIALHRVDPRTGEILDADVLIDDSWIDIWVDEDRLMIREAWARRLAARESADPAARPIVEMLDRRVQAMGVRPLELAEAERNRLAHGLVDSERRALMQKLAFEGDPGVLGAASRGRMRCSYTDRLAHQMAMARLAWITGPDASDPGAEGAEAPSLDTVPERLIEDNLIALTAHEIGHVLGLRHNFKASAWKPVSALDEYQDPAQEPPIASVMDYNGAFIAEPGTKQGLYNMVRVGAYDRWAIEYGYRPVKDDAELDNILARSVEPAHRYGTDEDVFSPDPVALPYDVGNDPVEGRTRQLRLIDRVRSKLVERLSKDGESWADVRTGFMVLWFNEMFALWDLTGWIGGTYLNRDHKTEGAPAPLVNVDPERQRAVLKLLTERAFSPGSFTFDPSLLNHLQLEKWYQPSFDTFTGWGQGDLNVYNQVNLLQFFLLSDLMYWSTPRLLNQELRADPQSDAFTVPELHQTLTDAIWSEFRAGPTKGGDTAAKPSNIQPRIGAVRRNLQREHAEQLVDLAYRSWLWTATSRQAQVVATAELRRVHAMLEPWAAAGAAEALDDYTRIHIQEVRELIRATLEAQVQRRP